MKKTINVNLNGRVFTIDEDAYHLLENYLNNLRLYFRKAEGITEIIADFEKRIEEMFNDKIRLGYHVITFEHVEEVIVRVGKPADFAFSAERKEEKQATQVETEKGKKKLYRNMDNKMIGGVCSGIASYFGWNAVALRVILLVLVFSSVFVSPNFGFWIFIAYLIAFTIIPAANTTKKELQMQGRPVKTDNIIIWILFFILSVIIIIFIWRYRPFHPEFFTTTYSIHGDGIPSRKVFKLDTQSTGLITGNNMNVPVQIEQSWNEVTSSIRLEGDQNLVEKVNYKIYKDGRLLLYADNMLNIQDNLKITIRTRDLKSIDVGMLGKVFINRAFSGNELKVKVIGDGIFRADSLNFRSLTVKTEDKSHVNLAGKTEKANFDATGTGKTDAIELLSDTVYASVSSVGSIYCNPVKYLEGSVSGVGSILYKEEPENKHIRSSEAGKIRKW